MFYKLQLSKIVVVFVLLGMSVNLAGQNSQQTIEEIEVFADSRRTEGLTEANASISVLGEEELDLILQTHYRLSQECLDLAATEITDKRV